MATVKSDKYKLILFRNQREYIKRYIYMHNIDIYVKHFSMNFLNEITYP